MSKFNGNIDNKNIENFNEIPGYGVSATISGRAVFVGNSKLMNSNNIEIKSASEVGTVVYVAIDNEFVGYIVLQDEIKKDAMMMIENLKKLGVSKFVMLTGDNEIIAKSVAQTIGITEYYSGLLPNDKAGYLETIKGRLLKGRKVVFVGDGINDAPVLSLADIGISMGGVGSQAAIEASDIVIMDDNISKISTAIKIAKLTKRVVWQNIFFAIFVKILVLMLGAGGIATMWEAIFADVGVTLIAIFNSMRVHLGKIQGTVQE